MKTSKYDHLNISEMCDKLLVSNISFIKLDEIHGDVGWMDEGYWN